MIEINKEIAEAIRKIQETNPAALAFVETFVNGIVAALRTKER